MGDLNYLDYALIESSLRKSYLFLNTSKEIKALYLETLLKVVKIRNRKEI